MVTIQPLGCVAEQQEIGLMSLAWQCLHNIGMLENLVLLRGVNPESVQEKKNFIMEQ